MRIYFSGGPADRMEREIPDGHQLILDGASFVYSELDPEMANPRRRGLYVRVTNGDIALWWGWDGDRPDLAENAG
jgi:hypothetical protein